MRWAKHITGIGKMMCYELSIRKDEATAGKI
jgi:hypothetical protein